MLFSIEKQNKFGKNFPQKNKKRLEKKDVKNMNQSDFLKKIQIKINLEDYLEPFTLKTIEKFQFPIS